MRLSRTQKEVLFILYAIEVRGNKDPVPATAILRIVNKGRETQIFPSNFRAGLHTMVSNGLLLKYRADSLQLAFRLSEDGRNEGQYIYQERTATKKAAD